MSAIPLPLVASIVSPRQPLAPDASFASSSKSLGLEHSQSMPQRVAGPIPSAARIATTVLLVASVLWCAYWFVHAWNYWEDDAYIHLEFARSLASGHGFAFNGHVVAGDTAPLWVIWLAAMHALLPDWLVAGKVLTVFGAAFGLVGFYAFARRVAQWLSPSPVAVIFPAAMIFLIVINSYSCYWLFSGMEPVAAAGLACFAVLCATQQAPRAATFLTGCFLAGMAPLLRPEMVFLTLLLAIPLLGQWRHIQSAESTSRAAIFTGGLVLIAAPFLLWSLYSLHAFGHLLPNTNAAKRASPQDSVVLHLLWIYSLGLPLLVCGAIGGLAYLAVRAPRVRNSIARATASIFAPASNQDAPTLPLAGWLFILWALINTVFYIANHTYVQTRYIFITAPALTVILVAVALKTSEHLGRVFYIAGVAASLFVSLVTVRPFIQNKGINCLASRDFAFFMRDHIPPDAPVAVYSIGEIAFYSQHPLIDTGGITRPDAIPFLNDGAQQYHWARAQGAQYVIGVKPEPAATLAFSEPEKFIGWTLQTSKYQSISMTLELWKLPPQPNAPLQQSR